MPTRSTATATDARLERAHVLGDVDVLSNPQGEVPHQRPRLSPPEVPLDWAVMAVAGHMGAQPAAGGDAEAVRSALFAAVEEATPHKKRPALRCACGAGDKRAVAIDGPALRGRRAAKDRPEDRVEVQLRCQQCQGPYERRREEEVVRGTGGGGACVVPVLSGSSESVRAMNILVHGRVDTAPPPKQCGGACVPLLDVGEGGRCGASSVRQPNTDGHEQCRHGAREELLLAL